MPKLRSCCYIAILLLIILSLASASGLADVSNRARSITPMDLGGQYGTFDITGVGAGTNETIIICFFYGSGCPHCALIEPYVDSIAAKYPQTTLQKLEVYYNSTNRALFQDFNARFNIDDPMVPAILVEDQALLGEDAIKANLESIIVHAIEANNNGDNGTNNNQTGNNTGNNSTNGTNDNNSSNNTNGTVIPPNDGGTSSKKDLTVAMVIIAAAMDSINPCAISVMIILLIFLTSLGNKMRVLLVGLVYIITVYIVYFSAGLGILAFLQSTTMTRAVFYMAAFLSIAIGLINIKDYFSSREKATLAIPESRKPMIKRYIEKASIPAAVGLGVVVSLFELPCTGGIYFAILSLLGDSMTASQGLPYLALYNLIYVLPLAVILGIFFMGVSADKANSWRLENRKTLRLAIGLVMVLLGAMMLLGVF